MTDEWNPEKDRDPMDRAREMMEEYMGKAKEMISPVLPLNAIGGEVPMAYRTVQQIQNGYLVVSPGGGAFYCPTIQDVFIELARRFK